MLGSLFAQPRKKALIPYVTAGDPNLSELPAILQALEEGGADAVEVGIPFSDPIADGPTIQAASQRALDRKTTLDGVFHAVSKSRVNVPLIYMGYTNMAMRRGFAAFAADARASGASSVILSDMTPDEATEWRSAARSAELDTIFLVAPTSTDERIRLAAEASSGFLYCVSRMGVTGAGTAVPPEVVSTVGRIRSLTDLPVCVGFGISKKEHVEMVCKVADGTVVGSYLVDILHRVWGFPKGRDEIVRTIRTLKEGTLQSQ